MIRHKLNRETKEIRFVYFGRVSEFRNALGYRLPNGFFKHKTESYWTKIAFTIFILLGNKESEIIELEMRKTLT